MLIYYLITWTTYGYWLPGDPRGFRTYNKHQPVPPPARYAKYGEETFDSEQYEKRLEHAGKLSGEPVRLSHEQTEAASQSIVDIGRRFVKTRSYQSDRTMCTCSRI